MRHYHITRVLYIALIAFIISTGLVIFAYSKVAPARADDTIQPFEQYSGYVDSVIPNLTAAGLPNPSCPVYTVVTNNDLTDGLPPEFGIFIPPILPAPTFYADNLVTPGTPLIGGVVPIPNLACLAPVPVYPIFYDLPDGGFYLTGTGSIPGE